jgi:hypothetical protein
MSTPSQPELFPAEETRSLLDQLLRDSRLYRQSKDYRDLLDFVVKLRNFAPFNAMLLNIQKPGLGYAASAEDWLRRFGRTPRAKARPLLILWPFGPVALVFDVVDTEGRDLPADVAFFPAHGPIDNARVGALCTRIARQNIVVRGFDGGDRSAGSIQLLRRATEAKKHSEYRLDLNRNHAPPVQFATLVHELGHLFLGHLGPDRMLNIPERSGLDHTQEELEAESVSFILCERNGVASKAEAYLTRFVTTNATVDDIDVYQVMRAAGQVETLLGIAAERQHKQSWTPRRT